MLQHYCCHGKGIGALAPLARYLCDLLLNLLRVSESPELGAGNQQNIEPVHTGCWDSALSARLEQILPHFGGEAGCNLIPPLECLRVLHNIAEVDMRNFRSDVFAKCVDI